MRSESLRIMAFCAMCLALQAQAQTSSGTAGSSSSDPRGSSGSPSSSQPGWSGRQMSPTGRMGHQELRASQLTGAQVTGSGGNEIGTISDVIINPASGRIDFAVISLGGAGGAGASSLTSGAISSASSSTAGKQVAVPWMLLRSSAAGGVGSSSVTSTTGQQMSFTFSGDVPKLQAAPNFDATTDLSQPSWRQSVFSYFGLSGTGSATGGAESPGSSSSSSGSPTYPSGSSGSTPQPNPGSSNP